MKPLEIAAIIAVVALGAVLRLHHLPQTLMFRGDQGRDAIIAKNILKERDIALIGPVTSVGNMYLGPLYYYFMVPFLAITYPDPVGPAYGVAFLSIITIYLSYWVGKRTFNTSTGIVAALIFAIMPEAIIYGRFSWNPNIAPFFSILIFYGLYSWWQKRSLKTFFVTSFLTGLLAQTHYVSLTVVGVMGLLWLFRWRDKKYLLSVKELGMGILGFGLTTLPLIIFDFRHNHLITHQFVSFFTSPEKHIGVSNFYIQLLHINDKAVYILATLLHAPQTFGGDGWILLFGLGLLLLIGLTRRKNFSPGSMIGLSWLVLAIVGTSFYSHTTYAHYLTYCFPIIALFWGKLITTLAVKKYYWSGAAVGLFVLLVELTALPQVGWQGNGTAVLVKAVDQSLPLIQPPYNVTLLSDDKDYKGMSYRYFFETSAKKPLSIDSYSNLSTLVVIDETFLPDPLSVPIYEIKAADDMKFVKKIVIPDGPWIYIYKKG